MSHQSQPPGSDRLEQATYRRLGLAAIGLLVLGTVTYRFLEGWTWVDSLYFSTVALTTVGFGDLTPSSDPAKLFTVAYILSGISILLAFLNARLARRKGRLGPPTD